MAATPLLFVLVMATQLVTAGEPTWFKQKYAALIEIANAPRGAEQIASLFGSGEIEGLDEVIREGWRLMPYIDKKPIVKATSARTLEVSHLITSPDAFPAINGMFATPEGTANAQQAVLSRVCALPGAYILGQRGYRFGYVFWTPTFRQFGPLLVDLSDCSIRSPFAN